MGLGDCCSKMEIDKGQKNGCVKQCTHGDLLVSCVSGRKEIRSMLFQDAQDARECWLVGGTNAWEFDLVCMRPSGWCVLWRIVDKPILECFMALVVVPTVALDL